MKMVTKKYIFTLCFVSWSRGHPHYGHRQTFKVIDLDGSDDQKCLVEDTLVALTSHNAIQILQEQPSPQELHFWVNKSKHTQVLNNSNRLYRLFISFSPTIFYSTNF